MKAFNIIYREVGQPENEQPYETQLEEQTEPKVRRLFKKLKGNESFVIVDVQEIPYPEGEDENGK